MPTANSSASKEVVTAALLMIGGKILSARAKDQNIGYIAEYLTAVGFDLKVGGWSAIEEKDRRSHARKTVCTVRSAARAQHECGAARPRCTEARAGQT